MNDAHERSPSFDAATNNGRCEKRPSIAKYPEEADSPKFGAADMKQRTISENFVPISQLPATSVEDSKEKVVRVADIVDEIEVAADSPSRGRLDSQDSGIWTADLGRYRSMTLASDTGSAADSEYGFSERQLLNLIRAVRSKPRSRAASISAMTSASNAYSVDDSEFGLSDQQLARLNQRRLTQGSTQSVRSRQVCGTAMTTLDPPDSDEQSDSDSRFGLSEKALRDFNSQNSLHIKLPSTRRPMVASIGTKARSMTMGSDTGAWDDSDFGISEEQILCLMKRLDAEDSTSAHVDESPMSISSEKGAPEKLLPMTSGRNLDPQARQNLKAAAHLEVAAAACAELMKLLGGKSKPPSLRKLEMVKEETASDCNTPKTPKQSSFSTISDCSAFQDDESELLGRELKLQNGGAMTSLVQQLTVRLQKAKEEASEAIAGKLELQATFDEYKRRWETEKNDMCKRWEEERTQLLQKLEQIQPQVPCLKCACRASLGKEPQHAASQTVDVEALCKSTIETASTEPTDAEKAIDESPVSRIRSAPCSRRNSRETDLTLDASMSPRAAVLRVAKAFGDDSPQCLQTPVRNDRFHTMPDVNECIEKMRAPLTKRQSFLAQGSVSQKAAQFEFEVHRRRAPTISFQRSQSMK